MYPYSRVVINIQDKCIRTTCSHLEYGYIFLVLFLTTLEYGHIFLVLFVTTRGTDTIVLSVTDYTGVRIYLTPV
jgi:hypothetical protein